MTSRDEIALAVFNAERAEFNQPPITLEDALKFPEQLARSGRLASAALASRPAPVKAINLNRNLAGGLAAHVSGVIGHLKGIDQGSGAAIKSLEYVRDELLKAYGAAPVEVGDDEDLKNWLAEVLCNYCGEEEGGVMKHEWATESNQDKRGWFSDARRMVMKHPLKLLNSIPQLQSDLAIAREALEDAHAELCSIHNIIKGPNMTVAINRAGEALSRIYNNGGK